ncbi:hypothetical protein V2J09_020411, partial [Rumex salicifolius]
PKTLTRLRVIVLLPSIFRFQCAAETAAALPPRIPCRPSTPSPSTSFSDCESDKKMISDTVQATKLKKSEARNRTQNGRENLGADDFNGRSKDIVMGSLGSCSGGNCGQETISGVSRENDSNGTVQPDTECKQASLPEDLTLQFLYGNPNDLDEDEDDSDWEPRQEFVTVAKWFCTNCTMMCGEHKESGILEYGFFAPSLNQKGNFSEVSEVIERFKGSFSHIPKSEISTAFGFDERMLMHSEVEMKSHPHPERPDRLRAIAASLAAAGIFPGKCQPIPAREITQEELLKVHSLEHIEGVDLTSQKLKLTYFTPDTYANEHSALAARLAAGLCADLAAKIYAGAVKNGFALIRPPGHHAGVHQSMGFCLHNNAAIAALAAQVAGAKKVLIVDWDVHHGNGTQEIFDGNKSAGYLNRHEGGRFYPGTGAAYEVGINGAEGFCVNIPWSRGGVGDNDYLFAFQSVVLPIAQEFAPDFTIISSGFDAARGDPLGCCDITPDGYASMTHMLSKLSNGKLLVILEGGYNLRSISSSATAVIKVLLGEIPKYSLDSIEPTRAGVCTVLDVLGIQMKYWPSISSNFENLQSLLEAHWQTKKKVMIKRRRMVLPVCWKLGRKKLLYRFLCKKLRKTPRIC